MPAYEILILILIFLLILFILLILLLLLLLIFFSPRLSLDKTSAPFPFLGDGERQPVPES